MNGVSIKNLHDWGSCKTDYTWNPSTSVNVIKHAKFTNI